MKKEDEGEKKRGKNEKKKENNDKNSGHLRHCQLTAKYSNK